MSILRLKDVLGNWIPIPTIKGDKGPKGDKGDKGDDGYTPVRGTDYWTTTDQTAIVADVLAALPDWNGLVESILGGDKLAALAKEVFKHDT